MSLGDVVWTSPCGAGIHEDILGVGRWDLGAFYHVDSNEEPHLFRGALGTDFFAFYLVCWRLTHRFLCRMPLAMSFLSYPRSSCGDKRRLVFQFWPGGSQMVFGQTFLGTSGDR